MRWAVAALACLAAMAAPARAQQAMPPTQQAIPPANPDDSAGRLAFFMGTDLEAAGKYEEAVRAYENLAYTSPNDRFADDALNAMARLYEEKLGKPYEALLAYQQLVHRYPQSNLAIRAEKRAELLRRGMGPEQRFGPELAEYNDILHRFVDRPRAESIARMEKLVDDHPDFPLAPEAVFWIGSMHQQDGRLDRALARFREVVDRWPISGTEARARKAIGDVLVARGDFEGAERQYRSLLGRGDAALDAIGREALAKASLARWRARAYLGCWVVALLFPAAMLVAARRAAGSWRETGLALRRPPVEFWYLLPVALLFVGAGMTEHSALGHAIHVIAGGALVVTWLSGATLEAARRRGPISIPRAFGHVVAAGATIVAVVYIAVTRERLLDMLVETVRFGAERN